MGFGYPNHQDLIGLIQYGPQKVMQALVFFLLIFFLVVRGKTLIGVLKPTPSLTTFICIVMLSTLFSESFIETLRYVVLVATIFLPLYLHSRIFGSDNLYSIFVKFCVCVVIINFFYIIIFPQYGIMTGTGHDGAWRGMFVHKNIFGGVTVIATSLIFYHTVINKKRSDVTFKIALVIGILSILMCKSATAIVSSTFFFCCYTFLNFLSRQSGPKRRGTYFILFLAIAILTLFILNIFLDTILEALGKDPTLTGRTELWEILFYEIYKKPFLGFGLGHFTKPEVMWQFANDFGWVAKSSHNSFLDVLLGIGWLGFIFFMYLILTQLITLIVYQNSSHSPSKLATLISSILVIIVNGFSSSGVILSPSIFWIMTLILIFTLYDFKPLRRKLLA